MLTTLATKHLVHEADGLGPDLEDRRTHHDDVAHQRLAAVADALVNRGHAASGLAHVRGCHPERGGQIPRGLVELAHVPHDIHVAHVVAVPLVDQTAIGDADVAHVIFPGVINTDTLYDGSEAYLPVPRGGRPVGWQERRSSLPRPGSC